MREKLINLDVACGMLNRFFCNAPTHAEKSAILEVKQALCEMDTMEVVRCKNCNMLCRNYAHIRKHCGLTGAIVEDDDFCSNGERREGE